MNASRAAHVVVCVVAAGLFLRDAVEPARFRSGGVPRPQVNVVGGGTVLVEADVDSSGTVSRVRLLRATASLNDAVMSEVRGWSFDPAVMVRTEVDAAGRHVRTAVASKVLVAAVFRAPALVGPTLGEPSFDLENPSSEIAFPTVTPAPLFPPLARDGGSVLVELTVDQRGAVADVLLRHSAPPFDESAIATARQWRFRPAIVDGVPASSIVYVVFVFPQPVLGTGPRRPPN